MSNWIGSAISIIGMAVSFWNPLAGAAIIMAGSLLFPTKLPTQYGPRLDDLRVTSSAYGTAIPIIYGTFRAAGNVIWATPLEEVATTTKRGGKGGGGQKVTEYSYFSTFAIALSAREIKSIRRIWCNKKIIFDAASPQSQPMTNEGSWLRVIGRKPGFPLGAVFDELRIYKGTQNQPADPSIQADKGVGNTPAYRGTAYILFDRLALADFGNTLPNVEVEVIADDSISVGAVVKDICDRSGVPSHGWQWLSENVRGYAVGSQTSAVDAIIPLALAFDFDAVEEYHNIYFTKRPRYLSAKITRDDLGATSPGNDVPDLLPLLRKFENGLPTQADVNYIDKSYDYQSATQSVRREQVQGEVIQSADVAVVLTATEARRVATRVLWGAATERITSTIKLSEKWRFLRCGDIVSLPVTGGELPFRITQVMRGQDGTSEYEVVVDDLSAYFGNLPGEVPPPTGNELMVSNPSEWMVLDTVLLRSFDSPTGFYWAVASSGRWRGADFQRARSSDGEFESVSGISVQTAIGNCLNTLGDGSTAIWDEINHLDVELLTDNRQLESAGYIDVMNGANSAWVGSIYGNNGEIIQWRNATLIAPSTYRLSGLLRGRLATDHLAGTHQPDEWFVLLDPNAVMTSDYGLGDYDTRHWYQALSRLADNSSVIPREFDNTGERARPRSPVHVHGTRDVSNNLTIEWTPRTRIPVTGLAELVPMGEASERYSVDIYDGASVIRTVDVTTPSVVYSALEQTSDGLTPGDLVSIRIYQISETRGRGHPAIATV